MTRQFANLLLLMAMLIARTPVLYAQDYTLTPGDSIVADIEANDLSVFNFLQLNTTMDTLYLSWEKVSDVVPAGWTAMICDNSICYPDLKEYGSMLPVVPGEYGLMSLHITAIEGGGTAMIRYAVWETNSALVKDTLTWIIHSINTSIEHLQENDFSVFTSGNKLIIRCTNPLDGKIRLLNLQGAICATMNFSGMQQQMDITDIATGIYLLELTMAGSRFQHKIFIQQ